MRRLWMSRADRARWRAARSFGDLGQAAADWWEGSVRSLPGHRASHSPHPHLTDHAKVLANANRAGFLVLAAQAGAAGARVELRAAVQGFACDPDLIRRLVDAAEKAGLETVLRDVLDHQHDGPGECLAVMRGAAPVPGFGQSLGLEDLQALWPRLPHAVEAVAPALQITLADHEFGPSTLLWETLAAATAPVPPAPAPKIMCRVCGCTWQSQCADGCIGGVWDQDDGRCPACIDPSIVIDRSKEVDDTPNECTLCGAPFYSTGDYCSVACALADSPWSEGEGEPLLRASERIQLNKKNAGPEDPWATDPF